MIDIKKVKEVLKEVLKFVLKTSAILTVCLVVGVPVLSSYIKPVIKVVINDALSEELFFINDFIYRDIVRSIEKQYIKITSSSSNIYRLDVANAIQNAETIRDKFPAKYTRELRLWLETMENWYKSS